MQSSNRLLGDIARLASGAMTMAAGAKTELEQLIQQRVERFLRENLILTMVANDYCYMNHPYSYSYFYCYLWKFLVYIQYNL